ncbi:hepcidin-like [Poeciliopsis prolifica]|uniref:hepcidin-like n=1 Tax=Poeciliopsis prolifica TaxID=188132 RepID=UPI00241352EE|nr:hepcidin-like [Poeciliopsis prolifica]
MRTFGVRLAVILLAFIYFQKISALLFLTSNFVLLSVLHNELLEEELSVTSETQESTEMWMMPYDIRGNHYPGPVRCRFCCGCCLADVCGLCCD